MTREDLAEFILAQPEGTDFLLLSAEKDHNPVFHGIGTFERIHYFIHYAYHWVGSMMDQMLAERLTLQRDQETKEEGHDSAVLD